MSLLRARGLVLDHAARRRTPRRALLQAQAPRTAAPALAGVDLDVAPGEALGVVGASGSGKTTLLRVLLALDAPDAGTVTHHGRRVGPAPVSRLRWFRREVQHVPQDPATSLDPRARVADLVAEPLLRLGHPAGYEGRAGRGRAVTEVLDAVQLPAALRSRRPGELSGGQAQRVALARALVVRPLLLLADEPVSGLDPPLRASVLAALRIVSRDAGTALVVVTHDLSALSGLCARTVVMDAGRLVEDRPTADLLRTPEHPATRRLVEALPRLPR